MAVHESYFDLSKKEDKLMLAFIAGVGGLSAIGFAGLPLLSSYILMGIATGVLLAIDRLQDPHLIPEPQVFTLDQDIKIMLIAIILAAGLYFSFITPLPQILMGVIGSVALGGFFISECVIQPQKKLNLALQEAVQGHQLDDVRVLLERGADPFMCDEAGNHCFHLAISDHETSEAILTALQTHMENHEKLTLKSVFMELRNFRNENIRTEFRAVLQALKTLLRQRSPENRAALYEAFETWFATLQQPLQILFSKSFRYLQQQIENKHEPKKPNLAGSTPHEMIALVIPDPTNVHRLTLEACFREGPHPEGEREQPLTLTLSQREREQIGSLLPEREGKDPIPSPSGRRCP